VLDLSLVCGHEARRTGDKKKSPLIFPMINLPNSMGARPVLTGIAAVTGVLGNCVKIAPLQVSSAITHLPMPLAVKSHRLVQDFLPGITSGRFTRGECDFVKCCLLHCQLFIHVAL
jgi:hypothetical protein